MEEQIRSRIKQVKDSREKVVQSLIAHDSVIAELESLLKPPESNPPESVEGIK